MHRTESGRRTRLFTSTLAATVLVSVAIGAIASWALMVVLRPADDVLDATTYTTVAVESGEVGASITLNVVAEWTPESIGANRAKGVVTTIVVTPGDEVKQGSVLYTVDLRPVVVAHGAVPAFRQIAEGGEGLDVAQAQSMLAALGFYGGATDGKAGGATAEAIRDWQESLGVPRTGVIELGDIIFVPTLPTRVALNAAAVTRGATLVGGEDVLQGLSPTPDFHVPATEGQAAMISTGTRVEISSPSGNTWLASAGAQTSDADTGSIDIELGGEDGAAICGDQCNQIPVTGESLLSSLIVTVPTVDGLVVPSAALVTSADGQLTLIDDSGTRIPVTVVTSARGMSVVDGISEGTRVRVPAKDTP